MINLLRLNNFYPVMSYRRVQKESDELLCNGLVTRYGPQSAAKWLSFTKVIFEINY